MARRSCYNCIYAICDPEVWLRWQWMGVPLVPQCANHPSLPGRIQDVTGTPCCNHRPKPVLPHGDAVRLIPLGDGCYAYVDAADYEWLSRYNWRLQNGYAARREKGRVVLMHREIMQPPQGMVVDHIDANKTNNCRFNLRVCTHAENLRNARKHRDARSRFKGVSYHRNWDKWCAKCRFRGRDHSLGYFDDEVEAARTYDRGAVEFFGEFARVNFPEEWPPERRTQVHAEFVRTGESSVARKLVRSRRSQAGITKAGRAKAQGKGKKARARRPSTKPRATRSERRATKQSKASKRKPPDAQRTTKAQRPTTSKGSRAETPGRGGRKQKTKSQAADHRSRATVRKVRKAAPSRRQR